jgi:hypothetical protein
MTGGGLLAAAVPGVGLLIRRRRDPDRRDPDRRDPDRRDPDRRDPDRRERRHRVPPVRVAVTRGVSREPDQRSGSRSVPVALRVNRAPGPASEVVAAAPPVRIAVAGGPTQLTSARADGTAAPGPVVCVVRASGARASHRERTAGGGPEPTSQSFARLTVRSGAVRLAVRAPNVARPHADAGNQTEGELT